MNRLPAAPVEIGALTAKLLAASSRAEILALDIVAGVAIRVVVVSRLLHRVPRTRTGHDVPFLQGGMPAPHRELATLGTAKLDGGALIQYNTR
jgi:hypothetical protein